MVNGSRRPVQAEDLYRFVTVADAQISPDGSRVAYVRQGVDPATDGYRSAIWIAPVDGGGSTQFTTGTKRDTAPRWSPDGSRLAFLSDRDDTSQLYVIPAAGGEPKRLTNLPDGAGLPVWSPDGTRIAFSATVQQEPAPEGPEARKRWEQRPRHVDFARYKGDGFGYTYDHNSHIFIVPADGSREPLQITHGRFDDRDPAWSPDGATVAFCSTRHETREEDTLVDLFLIPAEGGESRSIARLGRLAGPAFSPDGSEIAVYATTDDGRDWSAHSHIWLVPVDSGTPRDIMPEFDRSALVQPPPFITPRPGWTADGSHILFSVMDSGNVDLRSVAATNGAITTIAGGERQLTGWSFAPRAERIAFVFTDLETPADVAVVDLDGSGERRLTRVNEALLAELDYQPPRRRTFQTPHGEIDGWVMRPSGATGPTPLLVDIHGGPHGAFGSIFPIGSFYWLMAAAQGWTILATNPTGSGSYGREFARTLLAQWGEYDLPEQMAAIDTLVAEGVADPERLAVTGYSYGGYMTSWVVGHTDCFKAAIIGAPVTNLESFHGTSDIGMWFGPFEMGGPLLEQREVFRRLSPITYVDQVTTPCLILHGEADDRCPIGQGEEFLIGLRAQGKTAEMVRYPGGSHGFRGSGRPSHRLDYYNRLVDWITRYTLAAEAPQRELAATGD
ncbi:MAG: prolyl oligopeptidase family serine peptidase [Dehalococcoidia bacterium]